MPFSSKNISITVVAQPFSPALFTRGPPAGPDRLLRMLSGQISAVQAVDEWLRETDDAVASQTALSDPMKRQHRCTSCYLRGEKAYMLDVRSFGVASPSEFFSKYVAQGCWTRCLRCQMEAGIAMTTSDMTPGTPSQSMRSGG